ncbi:MAG: DNA-processing protein DprA [Acidimicrobiia bacterium]|nr:MAG: DNA-processing protein DprA [Acidimicrobiia bacterium]
MYSSVASCTLVNGELIQLAHGGMAPLTLDRLFERYGSPDAVLSAVLGGRTKASFRVVDAVRVPADVRMAELERLGVRFVCESDRGFPERLERYSGSPRFLFLSGHLSMSPAIGIVGTRTCTTYGTDLASGYGAVAADAGWSVVSGLARGIDGAGQRGSVGVGGHCHAVLGSGVDVVYPRSNRDLYHSILDAGGAVSSEYPPGTPPEAWRFPTRNRIIGLSDVLLVVEAGLKGGALITARIALDYGVPVYAVPGDVDRPASVGANLLIRDGAFPILGPEDLSQVLQLLEPLYGEHATTNRDETRCRRS